MLLADDHRLAVGQEVVGQRLHREIDDTERNAEMRQCCQDRVELKCVFGLTGIDHRQYRQVAARLSIGCQRTSYGHTGRSPSRSARSYLTAKFSFTTS